MLLGEEKKEEGNRTRKVRETEQEPRQPHVKEQRLGRITSTNIHTAPILIIIRLGLQHIVQRVMAHRQLGRVVLARGELLVVGRRVDADDKFLARRRFGVDCYAVAVRPLVRVGCCFGLVDVEVVGLVA